VCKFCTEKIDHIDYKDVKVIGQFISERGKILPRRVTGVCTPQRGLKGGGEARRHRALSSRLQSKESNGSSLREDIAAGAAAIPFQ
jgi:ribosomal protein S18